MIFDTEQFFKLNQFSFMKNVFLIFTEASENLS